jgi:hypothetical protein
MDYSAGFWWRELILKRLRLRETIERLVSIAL